LLKRVHAKYTRYSLTVLNANLLASRIRRNLQNVGGKEREIVGDAGSKLSHTFSLSFDNLLEAVLSSMMYASSAT
jgi:hypothetical protein